jgi:hypothetical protein
MTVRRPVGGRRGVRAAGAGAPGVGGRAASFGLAASSRCRGGGVLFVPKLDLSIPGSAKG